ncbi:MAG: ATP-binding cassette domain-containing protein, partial [Eggerthellaceae bacterium]|nr:ATP-binding cassette domain-containing protein [Eggerthellaceae bacterium]
GEHELVRFGTAGTATRSPAQLSGGQQQRVALARMLAARPEILMLDEPFSALDSHLKGMLEQNLLNLFDSFHGTILYVSHDIDEAIRFCDRIAVVDAGKIMEIDNDDELVNHPQSRAAIRLSGCKNTISAKYVDDHTVELPAWGIAMQTKQVVPKDVKFFVVRAFFLTRVDGPGYNNFHATVERVSDSRFDRVALLSFLDRNADAAPLVSASQNEISHLNQRCSWHINKLNIPKEELPYQGEEVWIHIPEDKIYLVTK